jgi:deoxyribodipyrimidine photolyase
MFNPVIQGERYDPDGSYVRRWVPELAHVEGRAVHTPRSGPQDEEDVTLPSLFDAVAAPQGKVKGKVSGRAADGAGEGTAPYPAPIVDHRDARERFLRARGALDE